MKKKMNINIANPGIHTLVFWKQTLLGHPCTTVIFILNSIIVLPISNHDYTLINQHLFFFKSGVLFHVFKHNVCILLNYGHNFEKSSFHQIMNNSLK